jgi:hypothetical protein
MFKSVMVISLYSKYKLNICSVIPFNWNIRLHSKNGVNQFTSSNMDFHSAHSENLLYVK